MVVLSLNSFCRHANSCMEDSFMRCGILFCSASARFAAAEMMASYGVTVVFVIYLYLKILSLNFLLDVSHLPIIFNIGSVHRM